MTTESSTTSVWPDPGGLLQPRERSRVGELIVKARSRQVTIGSSQATYRWDLSRLDRVVSFHAPDMILTVETGLTLNAVKDIVEAEKLWLPLDTPGGGDLSLAEYLAGDDSLSWLSHRYGSARDWIVGLTALDDQGREVTSGARVVRNASGYQLAPLYIGARDGLGPMVEVSFRLLPLPVPATIVSLKADNPDQLVVIWQQSCRISHPSGRGEPWEALRLEFVNGRWRLDGMTRFPPEDVATWKGTADVDSNETIVVAKIPAREGQEKALKSDIQIQVLPTQIPELLTSLHSLDVELTCYPAAGIIRIGRLNEIQERSPLESLLAAVAEKGGRIRPMTEDLPVKLPAPESLSADIVLSKRVKQILDPDGIFGPLPVEQW
ncbi:MAG: FAD-binding oxidoreductase [Fidelibacterota bacterium]|nr:MAG: FAD-binding oxidoreductase [Candidatus Neomarinimicrobiota bacterium]